MTSACSETPAEARETDVEYTGYSIDPDALPSIRTPRGANPPAGRVSLDPTSAKP